MTVQKMRVILTVDDEEEDNAVDIHFEIRQWGREGRWTAMSQWSNHQATSPIGAHGLLGAFREALDFLKERIPDLDCTDVEREIMGE